MKITTSRDLTEVVNSKANQLAKSAIALIKAGGPLSDLEAIVAKGCPHVYIERNPSRPRSGWYTHHVLDACFESRIGVVSVVKSSDSTLATLGPIHQSSGREAYFKFLLNAGFSSGSNNYRGDLFSHILNSCFYLRDMENQQSAMNFAHILIDAGKADIQNYVSHNYGWVGSLERFQIALSLGAIPAGSDMIDCALRYVGCSPTPPYTTKDRTDVIQELLSLGAVPTRKEHQYPADPHQYQALLNAGLLQTMIDLGAISHLPPFRGVEQAA
jgi:hypothetical protein